MRRTDHVSRTPGWWPAVVALVAVAASLALVFSSNDTPLGSSLPDLDIDPVRLSAEPVPGVGLRYPHSPPEWHQRDPGPLVSRMGVAAVWTGAELLVWGGGSMRTDYTSGAMYRPHAVAAPAWANMTRPAIAGGTVEAAAWTGRALFVYTTAPALYDPTANAWTSLDTVTESIRALAAAATDTGVVVIATSAGSGGSESSTLAIEYGRSGECCTKLAEPPIELAHATATWAGDRLVVLGAGEADTRPRLLTYAPSPREWIEHASPELDPARGLAAVWADDSLVAVDARLGTATWRSESGWTPAPPAPFEERSCWPRLTALGDTVFVWYCRQAAIFSPQDQTWTPVATPELPAHTISTSCVPVAAERSVLLWCGNGDGADPILWEYAPD